MAENQTASPVENDGVYYSQDFSLRTLNFLTSSGQRFEMKRLLVELSYYEDIYGFSTSGYITIKDAQGFIELLQLTGNEFIELNFSKTKNDPDTNDQLFRVYKIGDRKPVGNGNTEHYTLFFCSEELVLSEQIRLSKSYAGRKIATNFSGGSAMNTTGEGGIINDILLNQLKVNPKRINIIEETTGIYDFVVPRMKPFEAVSWLSIYARPDTAKPGSDMIFFENKNGYNYRSLQSMFKDGIYGTYKYQVKNIGEDKQSLEEETITVLDYEFVKTYDAIHDISSGTFANRLVSLDPISRTMKVTDFSYSKYEGDTLNKGDISNTLTNRLGLNQQETFDASFKLVTSNAFQKDAPYIKQVPGSVANDIAIETYVPNRTAQLSLANYTVLKARIPGDPGMLAGRTINFNLLTLKPSDNKKDLDKFYSGKYLVTAVRHIIQPTVYQTVIEIAKDSTTVDYAGIRNNSSEWKKAVSE